MTDLPALADRIEREGPSRELDAEIHFAFNPDHRSISVPPYTKSLDAAMTLVPEGWWISWLTIGCPHNGNVCILVTAGGRAVNGKAPTPAAALAAAAIRARMSE